MPERKNRKLIPQDIIENKIYLIRGEKVMLDRDLAYLYGVTTSNLNKAVNRNPERFPDDFKFQLTREEQALIFHSGTSKSEKRGGVRKPVSVFTEQGIAMLSSVLRSQRAILVNIQIMRTFVRMKEQLVSQKKIWKMINVHNVQLLHHGKEIKKITEIVQIILRLPLTLKRKQKKIGFIPPQDKP